MTSCDAPFLILTLSNWMIAALGNAAVAVPRWQDRWQPLHAVYRRSVMPFLKQQLDDGKSRPTFLYEQVETRIVAEAE